MDFSSNTSAYTYTTTSASTMVAGSFSTTESGNSSTTDTLNRYRSNPVAGELGICLQCCQNRLYFEKLKLLPKNDDFTPDVGSTLVQNSVATASSLEFFGFFALVRYFSNPVAEAVAIADKF